jgi:alkylhydroperoxidase/carboxymuconolactone decarboxylase family protein YurZ
MTNNAGARKMDAVEKAKLVQKRVVGPKYRSKKPIDRDLLSLITKYAFGDVWARPGLDIESRRLITMAMTVAGQNFEEFKLHVEFALDNGMDREVIKELMLHSAIYCGIPVALSAFRHADEVFSKFDGGSDKVD